MKATQIASAIAKSRKAAVQRAQLETIQPVVEFYAIRKHKKSGGASWQVLDGKDTLYAQGLHAALKESHGIYIFYDSRGHSIYVGKAREQSLWQEMNLAFNRKREVQQVKLVDHPVRNQEFKSGHEKLRQPKGTQLELCDMAAYFSAYRVDDGMIEDLEALLVRGFANDLLNVKMETFAHARK